MIIKIKYYKIRYKIIIIRWIPVNSSLLLLMKNIDFFCTILASFNHRSNFDNFVHIVCFFLAHTKNSTQFFQKFLLGRKIFFCNNFSFNVICMVEYKFCITTFKFWIYVLILKMSLSLLIFCVYPLQIVRIEFHSFFHHCHHQHNHCVFIHSSRYDSANFFRLSPLFFVLYYHYLSQNLSFLFFSFEFCFYLLIFHIFCCLWSWWRHSKIFNFLFTFSHTIYSCVFDHVIGTPTKKNHKDSNFSLISFVSMSNSFVKTNLNWILFNLLYGYFNNSSFWCVLCWFWS